VKTVTLYRHQERGVDKGLEILTKYHGLGIFFDPGLGKSLTALTIAEHLIMEGEIDRVVVVCPKTLYGTWQDQIAEHSEFSPAFEWHIKKWEGKTSCIFLTNYEAWREPPKRKKVDGKWVANVTKRGVKKDLADIVTANTLVIMDESTEVKSDSAQQTTGCRLHFQKAKYRIIMTGTDFTKSPLDLYSQFEILRPAFWWGMSFFAFKQRFAITKDVYLPNGKTTKVVTGFQRISELTEKIAPWIVRAKKEDCADLPPKRFQNIPVELSDAEWRVYTDLKERMIAFLDSGKILTVTQKVALFTRFRTITGGWATTEDQIGKPSKLAALADLVKDDDAQAIIWCSFTHEILMLKKELKEYGECVTYFGPDSEDARRDHYQRFTAGQARFFLANPATAGLGLNLQHCPLQYFYSLPTSGGEFMQALDRSHRIGTKTEVVYRFLLGQRRGVSSIDFRIKALLDQSVDLLHAFQTREIRELVNFV
jgi:SNF2 family DNA or RNA helicase